ncbi:MAG: DUF2141 domain-containing protein [Cryomorphaceae bacterium]|nr:MAG: DUF2141 domain-containing protein [Cryomorphaceae bacterium]
MKPCLFILLICAPLWSMAQNPVGDIVVRISGMPNGKGVVKAALFAEAEGFPNDWSNVLQKNQVGASEDTVQIEFRQLPYGSYVVSVFHDKNMDGELNTNEKGVPTEAIGFSTNPKIRFGPPKYERATFELNEPVLRMNVELQTYKTREE